MFIFNFKINKNKTFKFIFIIFCLICFLFIGISVYKVFFSNLNSFKVNDQNQHSNITEISSKNFTNVLKAVHDNIDEYVGKEIIISGYVYRVIDFKDNQFVIARDMIIDSKVYVVGFLSEYDKISEYENNSWVKITAQITKGKYHNKDIPILKIKEIEKIDEPENSTVTQPEESYIPTSSLL